ncbi:hypothetical protein DY000_02000705 [Brassica cretica]|uniref:Uncharacterized protein n=1 Tax=Brassica cretica TaxID=69181 RepID=A0ABQ7C611_BRACR|nr:hypothetical protein DY000_02000705 [Brassica cretica]
MFSDSVTAKRSSTEEESDSSVSKKLKVEDEDDTNMEDESDSDTDSGLAWSVETEEDEGVVRPPRINYLNIQDPEPEWDKDSFDGYECYDPEDRKSFSNDEEYEEFREFKFQAWKNTGFYEEDLFRYIFPLTDLEQRFRNMTTREYLADIASLCVKKLNEEKGLLDSLATMFSDSVTAKRSSTEEESDSSVSKKLKVEDEDDTNMEDESDSDTDSGLAWSVETEEDEGVVRPPRINYLNIQDPEPEWDKDSFDGYECYDPEDRKSFSNDEEYEEFREFKFQAWKNKKHDHKGIFDGYCFLICVKKLNEEKGTSVEFVSIVRGNLKAGGGWKLYITFMAREYPDGSLVEYQAKAMDFAGGVEPPFSILCRPAPTMS